MKKASKTKHSGNIQKRILAITLSCLVGMCVVISSVSYYIFRNYLQSSLTQAVENNLLLLADSINNDMNDVTHFARFLQTNSGVAVYIEESPDPGSVLAVATHDRISEEYSNNPASKYMQRVAVITSENFLQVVMTSYSSTADLSEEVPNLPYFRDLLTDSSFCYSAGIVNDPFYRNGRQVFTIIRPITYQFSSVQGGFLYIQVSTDIITSHLKNYQLPQDSHFYLTMEDKLYCYENGLFIEEGPLTEEDIPNLVKVPLNMKDCYISQSISPSELLNQRFLWMGILLIMLVTVFGLGATLMVMFNRMINIPVSMLHSRMQRIAGGDFTRDPSIEWEHELGDIGRGINDLSENVDQLMTKRLEDEKQKRDLEYKMLQSQINPHFIYNTLNSIKWMATIQGANGISEMTTALSRLLKSISKGTSSLISIEEELSLIENYFTIQSYRYGGTITLDIQILDEKLKDYQIIKFTLQPLVENAIFHGIEPKGTTGHIAIKVGYDACGNICIDITDDGIGMSEEKAKQILENNQDSSTDFFREIGVSNVHKRLQYEFGENYGISIHSKEGEYTTMSIHIPMRLHGKEV